MEILIIVLVIASTLGIGSTVGYFIWDYYHQRKLVNQKIPDHLVLEVARQNGGKVNAALLCEHTGVTAKEAKTKLEYLAEQKMIAKDWKAWLTGGHNYVLPNSQGDIFANVGKFLHTKGSLSKRIEILLGTSTDSSNTNSPAQLSQNKDAQIISLALENQGVVTASAVCVKLNITIDEAQRKLEELRQKQIFITEVGQNGGLLYRLLDV
jgi:uncharacterized protein YneF (UPF0154 family)